MQQWFSEIEYWAVEDSTERWVNKMSSMGLPRILSGGNL